MSDVAAMVAAGIALAALVVSLRAQRWARESAEAGTQSAAAAAESLRWSKLSAEAAQATADVDSRAEADRIEANARAAVRWEVTPGGGATCAVVNVGTHIAHEVTVLLSPTSATGNPIGLETVPEVLPGGRYTFDRQHHDLGEGNDWVRVSWRLTPTDPVLREDRMPLPNYNPPRVY